MLLYLKVIKISYNQIITGTVKKNKAFLLSQPDLNNPFDKTFNFMIKSLSKCESHINCKKIYKSYKTQILIEN